MFVAVCCLSFVERSFSPVFCCVLVVVCCLLFVGAYVFSCLLFGARCVLLVVCRLRFVVFVVCL